jgi:SEC-C motif-containing protein
MRNAKTAEQLMRSRYTAFVLQDLPYLLATWHPDTRPRNLTLDAGQRWLGLKIKRVEAGDVGDASGIVEFVARYKIAGRGYRLHEVSRFLYLNGAWLYVDGDLSEN